MKNQHGRYLIGVLLIDVDDTRHTATIQVYVFESHRVSWLVGVLGRP